jgi:hypothetical protein
VLLLLLLGRLFPLHVGLSIGGGDAAVDRQVHAGDEAGIVACEEGDDRGDVGRQWLRSEAAGSVSMEGTWPENKGRAEGLGSIGPSQISVGEPAKSDES